MTERAAPRIVPLGESAVLVEFGTAISTELNDRAISFCEYLNANPFPGLIEAIPAYASAAVEYDHAAVRRGSPYGSSTFALVREHIEGALGFAGSGHRQAHEIEIRCTFGGDAGPDLNHVAERAGLSAADVIEIFMGRAYKVYMLGFLPGFAYMGEVDERIATPRRSTPRTLVPRGSVGIAGVQTGVYSLDSPGGWQIIGRTDIAMFRPDLRPPSILSPGDIVRFIAE